MDVVTAPSGPATESDRTGLEPAGPDPAGPGHAHWLRAARETAEDLATDAVAREQAGKTPSTRSPDCARRNC